ncbi:MAG: hypothetical protein ACLQMF_05405 [Rectinemataceae bacterium]
MTDDIVSNADSGATIVGYILVHETAAFAETQAAENGEVLGVDYRKFIV